MDDLNDDRDNSLNVHKSKLKRHRYKNIIRRTLNDDNNLRKFSINNQIEIDENYCSTPRDSTTSTNSTLSSASSSSLSSSTTWEQSYSLNSKGENSFVKSSVKKLEKSKYHQKMTYVKKLTLKFEKLALNSKNSASGSGGDGGNSTSSGSSNKSIRNGSSGSNLVVVADENRSQHCELSSSSSSISEKFNFSHYLNNNCKRRTHKINNKRNYTILKEEEQLPSEDEIDEISADTTNSSDSDAYETCDMSDVSEQQRQQYDGEQVKNVDQVEYKQQQSIPGIFIEEIGESTTDEPENDNKTRNRLRESDTNETKFRQSDPNPKTNSNICEIKNRHVGSKSLSNYSFESNDNEFGGIEYSPSSELFSSKLSLAYDSKELPPIIEELIRTEETYIQNLRIGIKNYGSIFNRMNTKNLPKGLRGKKWIILGNIEQILEFHDTEFLPMLLRNQYNLKDLFDEFMKFIDENCFYSYVLYTMNKKRSIKLCEQYKQYFKDVQEQIDDKLGINSFLVQPIQRLARYPLILQQFIMTCFKTGNIKYKPIIESCCKVEKRVRNLLITTNEAEEINDIEECNDINILHQGKFKKMNEFTIYDYTQRRNYRSKVFIFDKCLIYTEIKEKRLIYRGCYPCEHIGFISKLKSFTLYYHKQKFQECEFTADKAIIDLWIELIRDMITIFAEEEKRKLKEKYLKQCDIYRRPGNVLLLRNSSRLSTDSGTGSVFSGISSTASSINSQEENSPRTTWYADSFDTL